MRGTEDIKLSLWFFSPTYVKNVMPAKIYLNIQNYVVTKNINYNTAYEEHGRAF